MGAPETFRDLSEMFDKGWRIKNLRVDARDETQNVHIELAKGAANAYTFRAPLPLRALSSNGAHGHWSGASAARAAYREEVFTNAVVAQQQPPWEARKARVSLLFGIKDGRKEQRYQPQDVSNAVSAFKAGFDGMVDARLFPDDSRKHMALGTVVIDSTVGPWVEVTVEAIE
jgi:hypothetical protein